MRQKLLFWELLITWYFSFVALIKICIPKHVTQNSSMGKILDTNTQKEYLDSGNIDGQVMIRKIAADIHIYYQVKGTTEKMPGIQTSFCIQYMA